jgi:hypothetical protein
MNKATIGALTMVLVGSVTFSFTNALLADHSTKKIVQKHATNSSEGHKSVDGTNQTENNQTSATDVKDVQTSDSLNTSVNQAEVNTGNNSEQPIAVNPSNTMKISSPSTSSSTTASTITTMPKENATTPVTTSTKPAATPVPATNLNTAPTVATSTIPPSTPAQATSPTTTTATNHGQQISQAAKEKASGHLNKKGTN